MNISELLKINTLMNQCLHCGNPTPSDVPFCSDKCKSDDYLQSNDTSELLKGWDTMKKEELKSEKPKRCVFCGKKIHFMETYCSDDCHDNYEWVNSRRNDEKFD